jgi:molybdopterin-synthase adenylyltransferase
MSKMDPIPKDSRWDTEDKKEEPLDRYIRFKDVVDREVVEKLSVGVIGVGAVGRQVALQLAMMGVGKLTLWDPDTVEIHNLPVQGYREMDVGRMKVAAMLLPCTDIDSNMMEACLLRGCLYEDAPEEVDVLFCCVDSMATRKSIWSIVQEKCKEMYVDGRISAEVCRVLSVPIGDTTEGPRSRRDYYGTLCAPDEVYQDRCTARTTMYGAYVCAGLMVAQMVKWLRRDRCLELQTDVLFNMLTMELNVGKAVILGGGPAVKM